HSSPTRRSSDLGASLWPEHTQRATLPENPRLSAYQGTMAWESMMRLPRRPARLDKLAGPLTQSVLGGGWPAWGSALLRKPVALDHGEPGVPLRREQES